MFLSVTKDRHRALIDAAFALHEAGVLPPDTYVIDADAVDHNAAALAAEARALNMTLWFVVKQIGRNPALTRIVSRHIPQAAAIDEREAERLIAGGAELGNVGHLVQIPIRDLPATVALGPRAVTVFDLENLRAVSAAAHALGRVQDVLLRIAGAPHEVYPGQEGGFEPAQVSAACSFAHDLPGVRVAGVTGFPCVLYSPESGFPEPTATLYRVLEAAETLRTRGVDPIVDLPSNSSVGTLARLAALGATHAEPGHALTGTTPHHAVDHALTEIPAMVYLTEVAQSAAGRPLVFGGGFYRRGHARHALIRTAGGDIDAEVMDAPAEHIDYYRTLNVPEGSAVAVGDGVVLAFRTQIFVTRSLVAVVSGLGTSEPRLDGVYDANGRRVPLDEIRPGNTQITGPDGWHIAADGADR